MIVSGKNINLRVVRIEDAKFICDLRQNQNKSKYLSTVTGGIKEQEQWLSEYKNREDNESEYYFIIESKDAKKLGLVRVYDFKKDSFCWGSWLICEDAPKSTAIESALQIYEFAFYQLGFNQSHFDVRKKNEKVVAFHKRFGAKIVDENSLDYFFIFLKDDYEKIKLKYKRYI